MAIWRGVATGLAAIALAGATPLPRYPPRTILLFVASWCAPCHAELGQIDAIGDAAGGFGLRVVPYDTTRASLAMLRRVPAERRWSPTAAEAAAIRADLFAATAALPLSVAIGDDGRPCATVRGGLTPARAAHMVATCTAR